MMGGGWLKLEFLSPRRSATSDCQMFPALPNPTLEIMDSAIEQNVQARQLQRLPRTEQACDFSQIRWSVPVKQATSFEQLQSAVV